VVPPRRVHHSFLEILQTLNRARVRYLVIGGVAVVLHGVDRTTRDLDIFPGLDRVNLLRLLDALKEIGFRPILPVTAESIVTPEVRWKWIRKRNLRVFTMMDPRDPLHPVDLMVVERVPFDEAWERRDRVRVRGVMVPLMSIGDLVRMKRIAGRDRDRSDIESLRSVARAQTK
jgi:predicted nucleotidyltransferase